jgi:8-oxo-dGTP diphosphatase
MANLMTATLIILIQDGKVLFLKRAKGWAADTYSLPGGNVELHESLSHACIRESYEELGIQIAPEDLEFVTLSHIKNICLENCQEYMLVTFKANSWKGEIFNKEPEKHSELVWFDLNELPNNLAPFARETLKAFQEKQVFSEHGW